MATTAQKPKQVVGSDHGMVERAAELSEQVLEQFKEGQEAAIEAVRKFTGSVDEVLPPRGESPSRRQEVIDSALEMSGKLVKTQYDFLTNVVHSAGEALATPSRKA